LILKLFPFIFIYLKEIFDKYYIKSDYNLKLNLQNGDWGLGIGDWGLGIGDWAQSPIPIPNLINKFILLKKNKIIYYKYFKNLSKYVK